VAIACGSPTGQLAEAPSLGPHGYKSCSGVVY
jgi:hypothetical protein